MTETLPLQALLTDDNRCTCRPVTDRLLVHSLHAAGAVCFLSTAAAGQPVSGVTSALGAVLQGVAACSGENIGFEQTPFFAIYRGGGNTPVQNFACR